MCKTVLWASVLIMGSVFSSCYRSNAATDDTDYYARYQTFRSQGDYVEACNALEQAYLRSMMSARLASQRVIFLLLLLAGGCGYAVYRCRRCGKRADVQDDEDWGSENHELDTLHFLRQNFMTFLIRFRESEYFPEWRKLYEERKTEFLSMTQKPLFNKIMQASFAEVYETFSRYYKDLSYDDCTFCILYLMGYRNEMLIFWMQCSDCALRQRKARLKKKLPEDVFRYIFV